MNEIKIKLKAGRKKLSEGTVTVKVRKKKLLQTYEGHKIASLYLDFYPFVLKPNGEKTRREFLGADFYVYDNPLSTNKEYKKMIAYNEAIMLQANKIREVREEQIKNGTYGHDKIAKKDFSFLDYFKQVAKKYIESKSNYNGYMSAYYQLEKFTNGKLILGEIDKKFCQRFQDFLLSGELHHNTASHYYKKFNQVLLSAFQDELLDKDYSRIVKPITEIESNRIALTIDELKAMIHTECENPMIKNLFLFGCYTSMRVGDMLAMTWKDIYYNSLHKAYFIDYFPQKTAKKNRKLSKMIPNIAMDLIGEEPENKQEKVFKGIIYTNYNNKILQKWADNAGVQKKVTFHVARHTKATLQLGTNTSLDIIQKELGHRSIKTTQIYAKTGDSRVVEANKDFEKMIKEEIIKESK